MVVFNTQRLWIITLDIEVFSFIVLYRQKSNLPYAVVHDRS